MPDCGRKRLNIGYRRELVRGMDMPVRSTEATEKDLTPARRLDEAHIGAGGGAPAPELAWREAEAGAERMLPARPMRAVVRVHDRGEMTNHLGLYEMPAPPAALAMVSSTSASTVSKSSSGA